MAKLKPVPPDNISIYTLSDPFTGEVRYVGKALRPKGRLKGHLSKQGLSLKTPNAEWLRSLVAQGAVPAMTIIEIATVDTWKQVERRWIAHYRSVGANLNNVDDGGVGQLGKVGITPPTFVLRFKAEKSASIQSVMQQTGESFEALIERLLATEAARHGIDFPMNMPTIDQTIRKAQSTRWPKDQEDA